VKKHHLSVAALATLLGLAACTTMKEPDARNIAGVPPSGTIAMKELFAAGYGGGNGTLTYNGTAYPFTLVGAVLGPGGAARVTASGEVYKLNNLTDFSGRYTQWSGSAGLSRGGAGDLWLENNAGVIMHLSSETQGILLSLGKEEVVVRLNQ
jgi:hypothetical protein